MHIITFRKLREFWQENPDAENALRAWFGIVRRASWNNLAELKRDFPSADLVGLCTVFNIRGNNYRLVTKVYYGQHTVLIRFVMTHSEYDRNRWRDDCGC
jgi:mRNA interferase HigB